MTDPEPEGEFVAEEDIDGFVVNEGDADGDSVAIGESELLLQAEEERLVTRDGDESLETLGYEADAVALICPDRVEEAEANDERVAEFILDIEREPLAVVEPLPLDDNFDDKEDVIEDTGVNDASNDEEVETVEEREARAEFVENDDTDDAAEFVGTAEIVILGVNVPLSVLVCDAVVDIVSIDDALAEPLGLPEDVEDEDCKDETVNVTAGVAVREFGPVSEDVADPLDIELLEVLALDDDDDDIEGECDDDELEVDVSEENAEIDSCALRVIVVRGVSEDSEDCVATGESEANPLDENVLRFVTDDDNVIFALLVVDDDKVGMRDVVEIIVRVLIDDRVEDADE